MKKALSNISRWTAAHKMLASVIVLLVGLGVYMTFGKTSGGAVQPKYALAETTRGTLVVSVTGTGQVSATDQVDLKPKASGDVLRVAVSEGDKVKAGTLLVQLDSTDAEKSVRDARSALESAEIALQKLVQPADQLSLTQAENALTQAVQSKQNAGNDLLKAYDSGYNSVANAFLDLPGVMTGLDSILNGNNVNNYQSNSDAYYDLIKNVNSSAGQFRDSAVNSYKKAKTDYDKNLSDYKISSRASDQASIDALINETYTTAKEISDAIKSVKNFLDIVNDTLSGMNQVKIPAVLTTHESSLQTYTGTANNHLSDLLSAKDAIQTDKDNITNADLSIKEKTESLAKIRSGADPLDVQTQKLAVTQRQDALSDAERSLGDYQIRAPFDGVVAKLNVKRGDSASGATAVATLITVSQTAVVSLNEVDAAKAHPGDRATLTFDAFPSLTIAGTVASVDTVGTVTQGVVSYNATISFDTPNQDIKPGMSVSASIVIERKSDALMVPASAVKTQGGNSYVEALDPSTVTGTFAAGQTVTSSAAPARKQVEIGLSNDTETEITSGLSEGDIVVSRTITGTQAATSATGGSGLRIPRIGG